MSTLDEQIGERVHQALWRTRVQQAQLAEALGVDQAAVSRRLRGRIAWRVSDLVTAGEVLGVPWESFVPGQAATAASGDAADIGCSLRRLRRVPGQVISMRGRMPLKVGESQRYMACPA